MNENEVDWLVSIYSVDDHDITQDGIGSFESRDGAFKELDRLFPLQQLTGDTPNQGLKGWEKDDGVSYYRRHWTSPNWGEIEIVIYAMPHNGILNDGEFWK